MKNILLLLVAMVGFQASLQSQEVWSLEKCILHAQENNIALKRNDITLASSETFVTQAKHARYPSLNGGVNAGINFGRSIDPSTNDFISQSFSYNGIGFNTGVTLYNAGAVNNRIKQAKLNVKVAEQMGEQTGNQVGLLIAAGYINILFAEERLENAKKSLELNQGQLDQINKLINAGSRPEIEKYAIEAQVANGEQTVIQNQNILDISILNLKNLLLLEPDYDLRIEKPEINLPDEATLNSYSFEALLSQAMQTQPQIKAGDYRLESANLDIKLAKASALPSLTASGGLSSNYSSQGIRIAGYETVDNEFTVQVGGQDVTLNVPQDVPIFEDNPYFDQFGENLGYQASVSLNIPIYNRMANKANIQRSELNLLEVKLQNEETVQTLKADVMAALTDAKAAQKNLEASQKSMVAQEIALGAAQNKYDLGSANNYELITAQNNYEVASINYLIAKYDFIYKLTIVDFYAGKPINLN